MQLLIGRPSWPLVKIFLCETLEIVQKRTYFPPSPLFCCSTMVFFRIFYKRILSGGEDKKKESPSLFRPDSGRTAPGTQENTFENVGKYTLQLKKIHFAILSNTIGNVDEWKILVLNSLEKSLQSLSIARNFKIKSILFKFLKTCFSVVKTNSLNIGIRKSTNLKVTKYKWKLSRLVCRCAVEVLFERKYSPSSLFAGLTPTLLCCSTTIKVSTPPSESNFIRSWNSEFPRAYFSTNKFEEKSVLWKASDWVF